MELRVSIDYYLHIGRTRLVVRRVPREELLSRLHLHVEAHPTRGAQDTLYSMDTGAMRQRVCKGHDGLDLHNFGDVSIGRGGRYLQTLQRWAVHLRSGGRLARLWLDGQLVRRALAAQESLHMLDVRILAIYLLINSVRFIGAPCRYICMLTCVCPPMLPDAVLVPLFYFGCLITTFCVDECLKYRLNYAQNHLNKKIQ